MPISRQSKVEGSYLNIKDYLANLTRNLVNVKKSKTF